MSGEGSFPGSPDLRSDDHFKETSKQDALLWAGRESYSEAYRLLNLSADTLPINRDDLISIIIINLPYPQ